MKDELSLAARIYNFVASASATPPLTEEEKLAPAKGITIRFSPDVRRFIEHQAENLQCSVQDVVNLTMASVMRSSEQPQASSQLDEMCTRFRCLFDMYGIAASDIPNFLSDKSLRRSDLMNDEMLIDILNDEFLLKVAGLFNINMEWLKATSEQVTPYRGHFSWYKNVGGIASTIAKGVLNHEMIKVHFVVQEKGGETIESRLIKAEKDEDSGIRFPISIVIERVKTINGKRISVFDVCNSERWNYSRCRNHLKYIMMFCSKSEVEYIGTVLPQKAYTQLFQGIICPIDAMHSKANETWYPQQLQLDSLYDFYGSKDADEASMYNMEHFEKAVLSPHKVQDIEAFNRGDMSKAFSD